MKMINSKYFRIPLLTLLTGVALQSFSQNEFYNDGADVYVQAAGLIYVQGEVINDDQGANVGRIHNSGDVQLTGNWTNTSGTSNVFDAFATGTTTFLGTGAVQTIGGTFDTYFNNLAIVKSGGTTQEVRQLRNSLCDGVLNLTNDFLNTQTFVFLVANPAIPAIQRSGAVAGGLYNDVLTEGYVTSTPGSAGRLARASSNLAPGILFFPVGNGTRFRPVEITPTSVGNNAYSVQFVNLPPFSPTLRAPTLDIINPAWYHFIERQVAAGSPENIRIYDNFVNDNICDINYVTMSEWNLALWADLSPTTANAGAGAVLGWVNKAGYPGAYPTPWVSNAFALAGLFVSPGVTSCVFPVEMIDLTATPKTDFIQLDWGTNTETNNSGFYVDRSTDGEHFSEIGWVSSPVGTSSTPTSYNYPDHDVVTNQMYFYRLRQRDIDGNETPSNTVQAILLSGGSLLVSELYPNPADQGAYMDVFAPEDGQLSFNVVNKLGQQLLSRDVAILAGQNKIELPVGDLASGTYSVMVKTESSVMVRKLVIRH